MFSSFTGKNGQFRFACEGNQHKFRSKGETNKEMKALFFTSDFKKFYEYLYKIN